LKNSFSNNNSNSRTIDKVVLLGSGLSILQLSKEEKDYINKCKYVIAINKFMAFYQKAGILPNYIYFHDKHENSFNFYRYIIEICKKDKLTGLTFLTNPIFAISPGFPLLYAIQLKIKRLIFRKNRNSHYTQWLKLYNKYGWFTYPGKSHIVDFETSNYLEGGNWAKSLKEPIFHFRGSLTSVLNLCSILFPSKEIYLVGTDFNNSSYFFEDEINQLDFEWKDFTHPIVKDKGIHYSYQPVQGKLMEDMFPFILNSLKQTGNELFCTNPKSLLVNSGITYKALNI